MSREKDMFKVMSILLDSLMKNSDNFNNDTVFTVDRSNVKMSELVKFVNDKIEKEGIADCQDEVSLAVLRVLSSDSYSTIPELVNRLQGKYTKGKIQNRLTKLVNAGKVERGDVIEVATGKSRKGYKLV